MAESNRQREDGESLGEWRLRSLEDEMKELVRAFQGATSTLGAQITALSNQIGTGLAALPEHYAPRREAEERHRAIGEQLDDLDRRLDERKANVDKRFDSLEKNLDQRITSNSKSIDVLRGWLVGAVIAALGACATAVLDLLKPK